MLKNIGVHKEGEVSVVEQLHEKPKPDYANQMPSYRRGGAQEHQVYQSDALYLPEDQGYTYLLVVVDTISGITDAEPIRALQAAQIEAAFKRIFTAGRPLPLPKFAMYMDPGTEFKNRVVKEYFAEKGILTRYGKTGRSRQQAFAENRNKFLAQALFQGQVEKELTSGQTNTEWVDDVPKVIQAINDYQRPRYEKSRRYWEARKTQPLPALKPKVPILEVGTPVRIIQEEPHDVFGRKTDKRWRATDIRWEPKEYKITNVILTPRQPVLYQVNHPTHPTTGYTRNQLQVIGKDERQPSAQAKPRQAAAAAAAAADVEQAIHTVVATTGKEKVVESEENKEKEEIRTNRRGRAIRVPERLR
jgi:hypothetical protein